MIEKMKSVIRKITLNGATFDNEVIEPTYVNFFYGRNGVGKSTVARTIEGDDGVVWQDGRSASDYDVLVYSQDFINRNFETYGDLKGVFTVSEPNIKIQKQVEEKTAKKDELDRQAGEYTEQSGQKVTAQQNAEDTFQKACWDKTRDICGKFPDAVKGTGRKNLFASAVLAVKTPAEQDLDKLAELYRIAYDSQARTYSQFSRISAAPTYGRLPGNDLMDKVVVSSSKTPFANFIKALNASDWVRQGHQHYSKEAAGKCPYCQQKLPANFEAEIAACFDEQYQQDISELTRFQSTYARETSAIIDKLKANLSDPMPALDLTDYQSKLSLLESNIKINEQRIAEKVKEPTSVVSLEDIDSLLIEIGQIIDEINKKIKANNDVVGAQQQKKEECKTAVWAHIAFILQSDITSYKTSLAQLKKDAEDLKNKASQARKDSRALAEEIAELNKQTVNTKAAIDSINALLRDSGFQGFSLREKAGVANVYEVIREDGSVAENLSEGERNFIAFLYFYNLVMPMHWDCIRGKYILQYLQKLVKEDDGVITCFRDGEVTLRSNRREDGFTMSDKEIGYQGIDIGDLVVHGMDGFAGAIGISDSRGKASPVLNVLGTDQNKRYIMYYLRSMAYSDVFLALATGIRVRSCDLRWNKLAELMYPVPPIEEQEKIVEHIDSVIKKTDEVIADKKEQLETIEEYKKSLIYEYVTGNGSLKIMNPV